MLRLFVAIELPENVKDQLAALRPTAPIPAAVWSKRHTYHLTLRFLGDQIDETRVPEIQHELSQIQVEPFALRLSGMGRFPPQSSKPARVLWVGVAQNPLLTSLYTQVESAVTRIGFPADDHVFNPHITLARIKIPKANTDVDQFLRKHEHFSTDTMHIEAFHLFSSVLSPQGASYQQIGTFTLRAK